jgi:hypothetical protein
MEKHIKYMERWVRKTRDAIFVVVVVVVASL